MFRAVTGIICGLAIGAAALVPVFAWSDGSDGAGQTRVQAVVSQARPLLAVNESGAMLVIGLAFLGMSRVARRSN